MNLLDLLFPKRCVECGKLGSYFCHHCSSIIRIIELNETICPVCEKSAIDGATHPRCRGIYTVDGLTSFFYYDGVIRKAVKAIKYRYVSDILEELMALIPLTSHIHGLLLRHLSKSQNKPVLIPIPLHSSRLKFRGFNQAELIGQTLAAKLGCGMMNDILVRIKNKIPQVETKNKDERLANMKHVFSINKLASGIPKYIVLVDDVFTTGATMREAANVLKRAGSKFVWVMTIAR